MVALHRHPAAQDFYVSFSLLLSVCIFSLFISMFFVPCSFILFLAFNVIQAAIETGYSSFNLTMAKSELLTFGPLCQCFAHCVVLSLGDPVVYF